MRLLTTLGRGSVKRRLGVGGQAAVLLLQVGGAPAMEQMVCRNTLRVGFISGALFRAEASGLWGMLLQPSKLYLSRWLVQFLHRRIC